MAYFPDSNPIAIVGMACEYPDARSPQQLWENTLAQRRAFRQMPPERLSLADYFSPDKTTPDSTYGTQAALIEGYDFDRIGFRVVGSTYRSADLAHWLALDVAARALADAGFAGGEGLPKETTGVLLGNTLTGEFSRAQTLRLRWPYVRHVVEAQLREQGMSSAECQAFLKDLEAKFKEPFAPIGDESLAGNLSNTIAGRICNHFDFKGGGYVLDGACSSSLLAVANACSALITGDLDVALAGGVDLSLDPFELVGFAKVGALTAGEMRVYDAASAGFIPGEGCGFIVLMRYEEALAQQRRIYSLIRGWGISSDGSGGITRPEVDGQLFAIQRAYRRAGFGIETVGYFEGHGTGTAVGDETELTVLSRGIREKVGQKQTKDKKPVIGSIKANIGHTKAAAGIASLIKATMAVHAQILPPTTGCDVPHPQLREDNSALQILREGEVWPDTTPLRAAVSAMGFGGINTHLVLEGVAGLRRQQLTAAEVTAITSPQDAELILLAGSTPQALKQQVEHLLTIAPRLSRAEIGDLATELGKNLDLNLSVRGAVVASSPQELMTNLQALSNQIENSAAVIDNSLDIYLGIVRENPKIGFLFPGQAAPVYLNGGAWERRFPRLKELYALADLPSVGDPKSTAIAQPAIITSAIAGLQVLAAFGIEGDVAVGHSLGELCALHWAGVYDETALIRLAKVRGKVMAELGNPTGTMASIGADETEVRELLNGRVVAIAGLNSPQQTVISGEKLGVEEAMNKAKQKGLQAIELPVSHAFHSPLIAAAIQPLAEYLKGERFYDLEKSVISTVTGNHLEVKQDLQSLLLQQVTSPVRFLEAAVVAAKGVDLLIEVGAGHILSRLTSDFIEVPAIALDSGSASIKGLLKAIAAAYVLGVNIDHKLLLEKRFTRPFNLDWQPQFFQNPCESVISDHSASITPLVRSNDFSRQLPMERNKVLATSFIPVSNTKSKIDCVRELVAKKTELPVTTIQDNHRLLSDLHLNSISVSQLVIDAARSLDLSPPTAPTDYADATVADIAQALEELSQTSHLISQETLPDGVDSWIRTFTVELVENPLIKKEKHYHKNTTSVKSCWEIIAPPDYALATALSQVLNRYSGTGIVICLPPNPDESHINLLLEGAKKIIKNSSDKSDKTLVLIQHGGGGAAFARTFHLENPQVTTCVVDVPRDCPETIDWILAEIEAATGYSEAYYDATGKRRSPFLRLLNLDQQNPKSKIQNLKSKDVLLVTGGGKGIAAECALAIAKDTKVRLALIGRSQAENNTELANNLERIQAAGITVKYIACDVANQEAVAKAIREIEAELGTITAIIHGAGINTPKLITHLEKSDFLHTLAPKVKGLQNLLETIQPDSLKLLITFGSIIARTGLPGEADYGLANEWLGRCVEQFKSESPQCHCLNLEWSVWSGVGMGERLGRIDTLKQQGITPIPPDTGIALLRRLLAQPLPTTAVVITGRFGEPPTLTIQKPELPFLRFLEQPRAYYPGVELVVDAELSTESDPYLVDHVYQGEQIFPGVIGLEAMAQVVQVLVPPAANQQIVFEAIKFHRPIVVPADSPLKIRIAALVRQLDEVAVVIRSEQTGFGMKHFSAICRIYQESELLSSKSIKQEEMEGAAIAAIDVQQHLYGNLLFHQGRFQRLKGYRHLKAKECVAEIATDKLTSWFNRYLPQDLVLGDAGARDAVIHALQACVPHATILPTGVEKLTVYATNSLGNQFVAAKERQHLGDTFIYDLTVFAAEGTVLEVWEGLELQVIRHKDAQEPWKAALISPYLERQISEVIPTVNLTIAVDLDATVERRVRSDRNLLESQKVYRRGDGKPELSNGEAVSVSHTGDLTLVVTGAAGCDVEPIVSREVQVWQDLLGVRRFDLAQFVVRETGESLDITATRIWCASECLKKAGMMSDAPLLLRQSKIEQVWLTSGENAIATFVVSLKEIEQPVVFAVLVSQDTDHSVYSLSEQVKPSENWQKSIFKDRK